MHITFNFVITWRFGFHEQFVLSPRDRSQSLSEFVRQEKDCHSQAGSTSVPKIYLLHPISPLDFDPPEVPTDKVSAS